MSLLEEWWEKHGDGPAYDDDGPSFPGFPAERRNSESLEDSFGAQTSRSAAETPLFSLDVSERNIARGRGQVSCLASANGSVAVVTSRGWLLSYDFAQSSAPILEAELVKDPHAQAEAVWLDASGQHCLAVVKLSTGYETLYLHSRWKKPRPLSKLKGRHVTAVAFNASTATDTNTGEIAVGTEQGRVLSLVCDEKDKKEKVGKASLELAPGVQEAVAGIAQLPLADGRLLLLVSTATRLYAFTGPTNLEQLAVAYQGLPGSGNFMELPSDFPSGWLTCYTSQGGGRAKRFAWLAGPGLYKGSLHLSSQEKPTELECLTDHNLLPLPLTPNLMDPPLAIAQTEYHELVLYKSCLHVINRVSQKLVQELPLLTRTSQGLSLDQPLGFAQDALSGTLHIYTVDALVEVVVSEEDRDMWQVSLTRNDFANAFRHCRNQAQRDAVNDAEASLAFKEGRLEAAAKLWGRVTSAPPSFEEVALKFVEASAPDALHAFLLAKLDTLASSDKAQATMVATWLTELNLDRINRSMLEQGQKNGASAEAQQLTQQLQDFLKQHVQILDPRTTMNLLASYGRLDDLMHYASCRQDNEAVLEYLVQRGEARQALAVLRRPDVSQELFYKFAPSLMAFAPEATVDACIAARPGLQPSRLLPALLRYAEETKASACRTQTLRYVQFCLDRLLSDDPAVHQLAVALYCSEDDEDRLLAYLARARSPLGNPLYDPQAALRLAKQFKRQRACVELLWQLKLFQDAVALALEFDMQLATALANRASDNEAVARKLWLAIACYLIQSAEQQADGNPGESIKKMNELMKQADGLIKIEDVLPLFPDFVRIDNFKEAICQSLKDYNEQIAGLKEDMEDATRIADALRQDVARLEHRTATLDESEPCASCGRAMRDAAPPATRKLAGMRAVPPYFLFPTGNAFHGSCLAVEILEVAGPAQKARIQALLSSVPQGRKSGGRAGATRDSAQDLKSIQASLFAELGAEDPFNGEIVVRNVDKLLILPSEGDEVASWQI